MCVMKNKISTKFKRALLAWATNTSYDQKRDFQNIYIEYYRFITLELTFSNSYNCWPSMTHEV